MTKADLERRIDRRPVSAHGAGWVFVTPSTSTPPGSGTTIITGEMFVGRREGPRAGLFRLPDNKIMVEVADTANVPILSAGARDYAPNTTFLAIGYADRPGIRLPWSSAAPGEPEQRRGLEVDAETLVGMLPPDVIPLAAISTSMVNWGLGAGQVSAADVPIADAGGYYEATDVEGALQEAGALLELVEMSYYADGVYVSDAGGYFASGTVEGALSEIGGYLPQIGLCCDGANVTITDAGGYFASAEVEGALSEIGGQMAYIIANWPA